MANPRAPLLLPREHKKIKASTKVIALVEPIHQRQPEEPAAAYRAFLIYRDLVPARRSLLECARIFFNDPEKEDVPDSLKKLFLIWQWELRVDSFSLSIQEDISQRSEDAIRELRSEVEIFALSMAKKIRMLSECEDMEDIMKHKTILAKMSILLGEAEAGKFMLAAYKTIVGAKVEVSGTVQHKVSAMDWTAQ